MAAAGRLWPALMASGVGKSPFLYDPHQCTDNQVSSEVTTSSVHPFRSYLVKQKTRRILEPERVRLSKTDSTLLGLSMSTTYQIAADQRRPSSQPHTGLKYGGASPIDPTKASVAGTSPESRRGNSADHNVKTRTDTTSHDGTGGGGVGVAEMRERKMEGKGLPSPQVRFVCVG
jgi:hypothetical protein